MQLLNFQENEDGTGFKPSPNRQHFGNYLLQTKTGFKTDRSEKTQTNNEFS